MPVGLHLSADSDRQAAACSTLTCDSRFSGCGAVSSAPDDAALLGQNLDRHQPGLLLEPQPRRRLCRLRRQHEGGADIGMARERDLPVHGEDADLRVIARRSRGGSTKVVSE